MTLKFYPASDELPIKLADKVKFLLQAANDFKKVVEGNNIKPTVPRELIAAYNWHELAKVLSEIRDLPESEISEKQLKSKLLHDLAKLYTVLSEAKMSKLEAVRLALLGEASITMRSI